MRGPTATVGRQEVQKPITPIRPGEPGASFNAGLGFEGGKDGGGCIGQTELRVGVEGGPDTSLTGPGFDGEIERLFRAVSTQAAATGPASSMIAGRLIRTEKKRFIEKPL